MPKLSHLLAGTLFLLGLLGARCDLLAQTCSPEEKKPSVDPKSDPLVREAEELFRQNKPDEAYKKLEEAVKKDPLLPPARLMMSRLLFAANQSSQGSQYLELVHEEVPHPDTYLTNAATALAEGRITDALLGYVLALQQSELDRWTPAQRKDFATRAQAGLATAYEARKEWKWAHKHLAAWLVLDPKNPQIRQRLARALFMIGKVDDAFAELKANRTANEKLDPTESVIGRFYADGTYLAAAEDKIAENAKKAEDKDAENAKKAEEWFKKAVEKYPTNPRVYQAYAGWLLDMGRIQDAQPLIEAAEKLDPNSRDTLFLLGIQARHKKDWAKAEKMFRRILTDNPGDLAAGHYLAVVLIEQGGSSVDDELAKKVRDRYAESGRAIRSAYYDEPVRALTITNNDRQAPADTAFYFAKILESKGEYKQACEVLAQALKNQGAFFNRKAAEELLVELKPKSAKVASESKETDKK